VADLQREVCGRDRGEVAVDLYAGVGLFTLPLAKRYRRVIAVESDRVAARFAARNARANRLDHVEVVSLSAESWIAKAPEHVDRIVVDPPRTGLPPSLPQALLDRGVPRLTYASCHAATLARDLSLLRERYDVTSVALVDMFPQTGHIEVVVQLELARPRAGGARRRDAEGDAARGPGARPGAASLRHRERGRGDRRRGDAPRRPEPRDGAADSRTAPGPGPRRPRAPRRPRRGG
jgi:hypothetical protein